MPVNTSLATLRLTRHRCCTGCNSASLGREGTGKTLVGRWHAAASEARQVLVLVPSLALLGQTLQEWRRDR